MSVVMLEANLADFLRSSFGPVGRDLARRVNSVHEEAATNAQGPKIGVRTGDLLHSLRGRIEQDTDGPIGVVGSNAIHRGFLYPAFVHRAEDEPGEWLTEALRNGFRRA